MLQVVPAEEYDLIARVIAEHPEGMRISVLEKSLSSHLPHEMNVFEIRKQQKRVGK